jgi:hypothetical protein
MSDNKNLKISASMRSFAENNHLVIENLGYVLISGNGHRGVFTNFPNEFANKNLVEPFPISKSILYSNKFTTSNNPS